MHAKTPNLVTFSTIRQWELHKAENLKISESATLSEKVNMANQRDDSYISIRAHLEDPTKYTKPESVKLKSCRVSKGLLIKENQLCVPNNIGFWLKIIKECHTQPAIDRPGMKRTLNMTHDHYYWPHMWQTIEQYIRNCHMCRRTKAVWDTYNRLLQLLSVPEKPWINVTIDFVTGLPKCHVYGPDIWHDFYSHRQSIKETSLHTVFRR